MFGPVYPERASGIKMCFGQSDHIWTTRFGLKHFELVHFRPLAYDTFWSFFATWQAMVTIHFHWMQKSRTKLSPWFGKIWQWV